VEQGSLFKVESLGILRGRARGEFIIRNPDLKKHCRGQATPKGGKKIILQ